MTKHNSPDSDSSRQADAQIEVTPEMIEAGVDALIRQPGSLELRGDLEAIVGEVYVSMSMRKPSLEGEGR